MIFEPVAENNIHILWKYFDSPVIEVGGLENKLKDDMKHRHK